MKRLCIICLLLALSFSAFAQEETNLLTTRATALQRDYLRPSMTRVYLIDGSETAVAAVSRLKTVPDLKFFQNKIDGSVFIINDVPNDNKQRDEVVKKRIDEIIRGQKLGNNIMKNWFPTFDEQNGYGYEVLLSRGQFAATDNDVLKQNASQRQSLMGNLGEQLIDRSYAVFFLVKDASFTNKKGERVEQVKMVPYVYKLDFNETVQAAFYSNDIFMSKDGIEKCDFPMSYVMNAKSGVSADPKDVGEKTYEDLMTIVGKKVADFQVKVAIYSTKPILAKIGKKEGVYVDKRFAVMEYRQDKEGNEYAKRIASVRAKKIADNYAVATGNTENMTSFYYIKGRPAHEGMTLVENPDFGISVEAQYNIGGANASIGYNMGRLINALPGFVVFLNAGLANDEDGKPMKVRAVTDKDGKVEDVMVLRSGLGFAKEFHFVRNFCFTPSISAGVLWPIGAKEIDVKNETFNSGKSDDTSLDSYYFDGNIKLGYMATREVQLFVEAGYSLNILGEQFKYMRDWYASDKNKARKDPSKLRLGAGIKIYF